MDRLWNRLVGSLMVVAGVLAAVVVAAGLGIYWLRPGPSVSTNIDPLGPMRSHKSGQLSVSVYDTLGHTWSKPMSRRRAESEVSSGLYQAGIIVAAGSTRRLSDIDATDIVIALEKPAKKIVVREPTGAIVDGKFFPIVNRDTQ